MITVQVIALAIGVLLVGLAGWERAGRGRNARAWTTSRERGVRNTLFTRPGLGVVALGFGLYPWVQGIAPLAVLVVALTLVGAFAAFAWGIFAFPFPDWAAPTWSREQVRAQLTDSSNGRR